MTYVQPGEDLELALSSFYPQIASPELTKVQVDFEGMQVEDQYPQHLPDLFRGSSLLLTGRYHATSSNVTVRVHGQAGDQPREYVYHYPLDQTGGHDFVPRLWATRKVGALLDRVRVEGENAALIEEIQGLGFGYGIVTPELDVVLSGEAHHALFRVIQQALDNTVSHAQASQVTVTLQQIDGRVTFEVCDAGQGSSLTERVLAEAHGSFGLRSMRDRIESQGGAFEFVSTPGQGTIVRGRVPVKREP